MRSGILHKTKGVAIFSSSSLSFELDSRYKIGVSDCGKVQIRYAAHETNHTKHKRSLVHHCSGVSCEDTPK